MAKDIQNTANRCGAKCHSAEMAPCRRFFYDEHMPPLYLIADVDTLLFCYAAAFRLRPPPTF